MLHLATLTSRTPSHAPRHQARAMDLSSLVWPVEGAVRCSLRGRESPAPGWRLFLLKRLMVRLLMGWKKVGARRSSPLPRGWDFASLAAFWRGYSDTLRRWIAGSEGVARLRPKRFGRDSCKPLYRSPRRKHVNLVNCCSRVIHRCLAIVSVRFCKRLAGTRLLEFRSNVINGWTSLRLRSPGFKCRPVAPVKLVP